MSVEYKVVSGFGGYRVGTDGSFWTQLKPVALGYGRGSKQIRSGEWRQVKPYDNGNGYKQAHMRQPDDGLPRRKVAGIHRLVLEAFVGPCPEGMEACHNDGDRSNNSLSNLRWDTRRNNHADKSLHGTLPQGEMVYCSKLTNDKVRQMRELSASGMSITEIAAMHGVKHETARRVIIRQTWKHVV